MRRSTHAPRRTAAAFSLALALGLGLSSCGEVAAPEADPGASTAGESTPTEQTTEEATPTETDAEESAPTETDAGKPTGTETDSEGATSAGEEATTAPADGEADGPIASPCASPEDPSLEGLTVVAGDAGHEAVDTAQQLLDLAIACDRDGLVALAEQDGTVVSLGATQPEQAFVSAPDADDRIHAMVVVLSALEPATSDEGSLVHVRWPGFPDGLDDAAAARLVELGLYDEDEVEMMEGFGAYTGWRVVVDSEGRWTFMGAGE